MQSMARWAVALAVLLSRPGGVAAPVSLTPRFTCQGGTRRGSNPATTRSPPTWSGASSRYEPATDSWPTCSIERPSQCVGVASVVGACTSPLWPWGCPVWPMEDHYQDGVLEVRCMDTHDRGCGPWPEQVQGRERSERSCACRRVAGGGSSDRHGDSVGGGMVATDESIGVSSEMRRHQTRGEAPALLRGLPQWQLVAQCATG